MELERIQGKIKAVLEERYGLTNVGFGTTDDGVWKDCPYIKFHLKRGEDAKNLDSIFGVFQRRILGRNIEGVINDRRSYVTIHVDNLDALGQKENTYRKAVAVIKLPEDRKQDTIKELAKEFYEALEEGDGLIKEYRTLHNHSSHPKENAKTRTIAKKGWLERNRNTSYWK